nr:glycoside hydrolase family 15 protein [Nakamurella flavida]
MTSGPDGLAGPVWATSEDPDGAATRPVPPQRYADLRSYAAIGDGRTVALIGRDGAVDWLPIPDLDSPPAFAALLDAQDGGRIELAPALDAALLTVTRRYVPGTNVLETTWTTADGGVVRVTDALNTGIAGRLPWVELARRVDGVAGSVPMRWRVAPGTCLARATPWIYRTTHGDVLRVDSITMAVRTLGEMDPQVHDQQIDGRFTTAPGSRHLLGLVATESEPLHLSTPEQLDAGVDRTIVNWQAWAGEFGFDGPWSEAVLRSALALKLLIHSPHGSVAAAATTSLPERLAGGKNWDYRYAWIRDTAYTLNALFRFGLQEETHAAVSWLLRTMRRHGPDLSVFYSLSGDLPGGHEYPDVPGWRGVGPVVVGNAAADQLQLGVFGDLFDIVRLCVVNGNLLDAETGRLLAGIADRACDLWQRRDAGIWELEEEQHYTSSKLGCWQALTCAVQLAELGQIPGDPARWRDEAERIRTWVHEHCWNADVGAYVWYPGTDELDASMLLHAASGFDRGPRMSSTIDVLRARLGAGPLMYRYSGMDAEEGTFVACAFWTVSALAWVGRRDEARELMDQLVPMTNDVGILAEMIDARDGAFLGNLPQGLSHLALMQAAMALADDQPAADPA